MDPLPGVGLAAVGLQGDAGGGSVTDDSHQLAPLLEGVLLMDVHLQAITQTAVGNPCIMTQHAFCLVGPERRTLHKLQGVPHAS